MPIVRTLQASFTAGELDPRLAAREDVSRYYSGAERMENVLVVPQGGFRRRPGLRHIDTLADGLAGVRFVAFAFNTAQAYLVVLTQGQARIYRDNSLVATVTGAPWQAAELATITWAQSADTLLVAHQNWPLQRLLRGATDATWTLTAPALLNLPGHDYGAITPAGTFTAAAVTGATTITASLATFTAAMVGYEITGNSGRARITAFTSATLVSVQVLDDFTNTSAFSDWKLLEPVISTARGWAAAVSFHQGRLFLGGFRGRPASWIGSKVGQFFDFDRGTTLDDEGLYGTLGGDQINAILAIRSARTLLFFTSGAEHAYVGATPITPKTVDAIEEQTRRGLQAGVPVVEVDGAQLFVQRLGRALREFIFLDTEGAYRSDILSLLSPHLFRAPVDMTARKGSSRDDADHVLIVDADGDMTAMTTLRSQEVLAFSRWTTAGKFRRAAALENGEVYFAVERSGTVRVELWDDACLLDAAAVRTAGLPSTDLNGMAHLEGQAVAVIADGANQADATVTAGGITLANPATSRIEAGLAWLPVVRTMPLAPRLPDGTVVGERVRIFQITGRMLDSGPFSIAGQEVTMRRFADAPASPLDAAPPVRSDDFRVQGVLGWSRRAQIIMTQATPQPLTVLGLAIKAKV
jgi:hypothetical protein